MKKLLALALVAISFIALAEKNRKPVQAPKPIIKKVAVDTTYRFGFVGNDTTKTNNSLDFGFRLYDSRLSKFHSIDPATMKNDNPYQFEKKDSL